jgi:hypothetical protein
MTAWPNAVRGAMALLLCADCKSKSAAIAQPDKLPVVATDAVSIDTKPLWTSSYSQLPWTQATRIVKLPIRADQPRFEVVGPVVIGDVIVVGSSQLGFVAVRWSDGVTAWTKPAGLHVAPPLVVDDNILLISDCPRPPKQVDDEALLGCLRTVNRTGNDIALAPIVTTPEVASEFTASPDTGQIWQTSAGNIAWRRGDVAVEFDRLAPTARVSQATPPLLRAVIKGVNVSFERTDEAIIARDARNKETWRITGNFAALLGMTTASANESPMIRVARISTRFNPSGDIDLLDIDATGSRHGQAAFPTPGIALLSTAIGSNGTVVLASRVDRSLSHDIIVAYDAQSRQRWAFALPEIQRAEPVGLACAKDAILAFYDGDTIAVLPGL